MYRAFFTWPGKTVEAAWLYTPMYVIGHERVIEVDLYSPYGSGYNGIACPYPWMRVSIDRGATWQPVPSDGSRFDLGPVSAGGRKRVVFGLTIPVGADVRSRAVPLWLGLGV